MRPDVPVEKLTVSAYTVPTDEPESDGTAEWNATTLVLVELDGGGETGLGYTYGPVAVAALIADKLQELVEGADALAPQQSWAAMRRELRNAGHPGVGAMAVSAVDVGLHDLRARLLGIPLARALGGFRHSVPAYGSGGFTSYSPERLGEQLAGWASDGFRRVKMKVGRNPEQDGRRLVVARDAIGDEVTLMVDANGAFTPDVAAGWALRYADAGVDYFEEPVSSDDRSGLRRVRDRAPAGLAIAAGEYNWSLFDAHSLLDAEAVDILQADVTRCGGLTELVRIDGLCKARCRPFSAHCAPAISLHACCAMETVVHLEYFHDHVRVERMLFDGVSEPHEGTLRPDLSRPGLGLELRRREAERYRSWP